MIMKITVEYRLPHDDYEYYNAIHGKQYHEALENMYQFLRNKVKYEQLTEAESKVYNEVYDRFHEILGEQDIDLFRNEL